MNEVTFAGLRKLHVEEQARQKRATTRIHNAFHKAWADQLTPESTIAEQVEFVLRAKEEAPEVVTSDLFKRWACRTDVRLYFAIKVCG